MRRIRQDAAHGAQLEYEDRPLTNNLTAAITLEAEAGRVYYLRLTKPDPDERPLEVARSPVDPAAAQLLIANYAWAEAKPK